MTGNSASQFAGDQGWFPLGKVLWCGDVVSCGDLSLLWSSRWKLFVLDLGFGHVVVARVKVLLLWRERNSVSGGNVLGFT